MKTGMVKCIDRNQQAFTASIDLNVLQDVAFTVWADNGLLVGGEPRSLRAIIFLYLAFLQQPLGNSSSLPSHTLRRFNFFPKSKIGGVITGDKGHPETYLYREIHI